MVWFLQDVNSSVGRVKRNPEAKETRQSVRQTKRRLLVYTFDNTSKRKGLITSTKSARSNIKNPRLLLRFQERNGCFLNFLVTIT